MPTLFFREQGRGRPIIFLHGFCDSHEVWSDFVTPLISSFRVLAPDLPGFGQSALLTSPFTIDQVADSVVQWMDECDLDKPMVIGHSLGGYVALSLLARYSTRLTGIGLFHSTPLADSDERKKAREKIIEFVQRNGVVPFIETFVPGLFYDKANPHIASALARALLTKPDALIGYSRAMRDRLDCTEAITSSPSTVLLIAGADDTLIPVDSLRKVAKMSRKCVYHELPQVAHMGFFEREKVCQGIISGHVAQVFS